MSSRRNVAVPPAAAAKIAPASSSSPPKKEKKGKVAVEKRRHRFRKSCPANIQQRIDRAVTQRLYLVQRGDVSSSSSSPSEDHHPSLSCTFVVLGSTGNLYTVQIAHEPSCDCPDHQKNQGLCKHILFVLLKVMGLPRDSSLIYQAAWLTSELKEMFGHLAARRVGGSSAIPLANQQVRSMYAKMQSGETVNLGDSEDSNKVTRKSLEEDSDCPICFDSMVGSRSEELTFCRAMCGANFHSGCIERWKRSQHGRATCPNCRQLWEASATTSNGGIPKPEGYANLGSIQGQSPDRDTSTYYSPSEYRYKRRRYW